MCYPEAKHQTPVLLSSGQETKCDCKSASRDDRLPEPCVIFLNSGGHGGRVVTLSPHTSEVGGLIPMTALSGKAGSCLPLVGSLQYTTLANSMYWFPLPFQLPVVI